MITSDISEDFFPELRRVAGELEADPLHMLSVMYSESACKADAWNDNPKSLPPEKRWNASGLIQFMPPTLEGLGYHDGHAAFRQLSATAQLAYVAKYYAPYKGHLGSVGGLYVATFLPALVSHAGDGSFVLTAAAGPLPWAYAPNKAFDENGDMKIEVHELEDAVARNCHGARFEELRARLEASSSAPEASPAPADASEDVTSVAGLQRALSRLGYDVGALDGVMGPMTRHAVIEFQWARGLTADGVAGPLTCEALRIALATAE